MSRLRAAVLLLLWPVAGRAQPANPSQDAPAQNAPARRRRRAKKEDPGLVARELPCPAGTHAVMGGGPHLVIDRSRSQTVKKPVPARRCVPNASAKAQKTDKPATDAVSTPPDGKAAQPVP